MFRERSSIKHSLFAVTSLFDWFDWLQWQPKGKICEKIFKNQLLRRCVWDKAETLQNYF